MRNLKNKIKRRSESLNDIPEKELFKLLEDTKIADSVDEEITKIRDNVFRTHHNKYPIKTVYLYAIMPVETFHEICRDTAYHLVSALGDGVGDFIDPNEYYEWTLKRPYYLMDAQNIIKKCDEDSFITIVEEIVDDFKYNGQEYIILEVE